MKKITRKEIARELGFNINYFNGLISKGKVVLPEPLGKIGKEFYYDEDIIDIRYRPSKKNNIRNGRVGKVTDDILKFLSGGYDTETKKQLYKDKIDSVKGKDVWTETVRLTCDVK